MGNGFVATPKGLTNRDRVFIVNVATMKFEITLKCKFCDYFRLKDGGGNSMKSWKRFLKNNFYGYNPHDDVDRLLILF